MGSLFKFFEGAIVQSYLPFLFVIPLPEFRTFTCLLFLSSFLSFEDVNTSFSLRL
jgi:hypothetical protein